MELNGLYMYSVFLVQVTNGNSIYYQSVLHLFDVSAARDGGFYQCIVVSHGRELLKSIKARVEVLGE